MNRAYVNTYEHNKRAISLFEKLGFKKEGILREAIYSSGRFQNIQVMSLLRREFLKV
jgi:RimJ/RimL family protein N-acetyltransferase